MAWISSPHLTDTYRSSQLITPGQLDRITIDQQHYQNYIRNRQNSPYQVKGGMKEGDGGSVVFIQNDLPVDQMYSLTALKLSKTRPWDQIVDPPLKSSKVIAKEIHLPFPQEHPYTSHTPQFAVFPDTFPLPKQRQTLSTSKEEETSKENQSYKSETIKVHAQTQTVFEQLRVPKPPLPYYVQQKAGDNENRVECRYIGSSTPKTPLARGDIGMWWDLPRSQKHKRAYTYPTPSLQYARLPVNPSYLPLPSNRPSSLDTPPITPQTERALESIHSLLTRSTAYSEHFLPPYPSAGVVQSNSVLSCNSQRPWTVESRGKYCGKIPVSPQYNHLKDTIEEDVENEFLSDYKIRKLNYKEECDVKKEQESSNTVQFKDQTESIHLEKERAKEKEMVDVGTQTEEEFFEQEDKYASLNYDQDEEAPITPIDILTSKLYKLPLFGRHATPVVANNRPATVSLERPASIVSKTPMKSINTAMAAVQQNKETFQSDDCSNQHLAHVDTKLPLSQQLYQLTPVAQEYKSRLVKEIDSGYIPRTVSSTRRMTELYNRYSRSAILKRFHKQYQEVAPDLRQYSIKEGKRHTIHGSNAYYYR